MVLRKICARGCVSLHTFLLYIALSFFISSHLFRKNKEKELRALAQIFEIIAFKAMKLIREKGEQGDMRIKKGEKKICGIINS